MKGLFITKQGVALPTATEMQESAFSAYESSLLLTLLTSGEHQFNAFEGFKFRGRITNAEPVAVQFNGRSNFQPKYITGGGSLNTSTGVMTPSTLPLAFEENNKVFLSGASFKMTRETTDGTSEMRIATLDQASRVLFNLNTFVTTYHKNNVLDDTETVVPTGDDLEFRFEISDTEVTLLDDNDAVLYSVARTYQASVLSGAIGVLGSSGTVTGDALQFDSFDTLEGASSTVTGTLRIESSFGQLTDYVVKIGAGLVASRGGSVTELSFDAGQAVAHELSDDFEGGVGTLSYSITNGQVPQGLTITSNGVLQGVPSTDGDFAFSVKVTDQHGQETTLEYEVEVVPAANANYNPPPAVVGVPYYYNPNLSGVTGAVVLSGAIPSGLILNAVTGVITGTPTAAGAFNALIRLNFGSQSESFNIVLSVVAPFSVEAFEDGNSLGLVSSLSEVAVKSNKNVNIVVEGGSGQYQYSITNGNGISSGGEVEFFNTGSTTVTVTDLITGQVLTFDFFVQGQGDICGLAVLEAGDESMSAPCTEMITDCRTPLQIAFNGMHILKGIDSGETPYREYPYFIRNEGSKISRNGKTFAMFQSLAANGYAVANNAKDGRAFILEFAVDATLANSVHDFFIGVTPDFAGSDLTETNLNYALVITTVNAERKVELRAGNVYQVGSRFDIAEGQQVGFSVIGSTINLYIDGLLVFSLATTVGQCIGFDIVFLAKAANLIAGGRASNLVYSIESGNDPSLYGTINPQTGLYTPSINNAPLVRIAATSTTNPDVTYHAKVRVIKSGVKTSLEKAMIEGIPVDIWIAELPRKDNNPLRLSKDGMPDHNQLTNPEHLGTLAGSGRIEPVSTRQDFRHDRGATSTSLVIDKVTITGGYLAVRNQPLTKRLIAFMSESNSHGVKQLKQHSTGCQPQMRVIMVWRSADCEDVPVYDAIEIVNARSYTMFTLEVGQAVQSQIPLMLEGFPDKDGILFEYNQYDKHFSRIGADD